MAVIAANAQEHLLDLSHAFIRANADEKEAILAGMEYERWLVEACKDACGPTRSSDSRFL